MVFQTSLSSQSKAVQLATHSPWSHMGMVVRVQGKWMVLEAIQPVKLTPLEAWIRRGKGGHVMAKRLANADQVLTGPTLDRMRREGVRFLNKSYDLAFEWSDTKIYCSELVWKVYQRGAGIELGTLQKLREFDLGHPLVKKKMKERYPHGPPLEEPVISPQRIFECPKLVKAWER